MGGGEGNSHGGRNAASSAADEEERTIQLALETAEINADLQKSLADDVNFVPDHDDGDGELL